MHSLMSGYFSLSLMLMRHPCCYVGVFVHSHCYVKVHGGKCPFYWVWLLWVVLLCNIFVNAFWWLYVHCYMGYKLKSENAGSQSMYVFSFIGIWNSFPMRLYQYALPATVCECSSSTSSPVLSMFCLFHFSHSGWCEVISHFGFNLHFPNDKLILAPLHRFTGHLDDLFWIDYVFCPSFYWVFSFSYRFARGFFLWVGIFVRYTHCKCLLPFYGSSLILLMVMNGSS